MIMGKMEMFSTRLISTITIITYPIFFKTRLEKNIQGRQTIQCRSAMALIGYFLPCLVKPILVYKIRFEVLPCFFWWKRDRNYQKMNGLVKKSQSLEVALLVIFTHDWRTLVDICRRNSCFPETKNDQDFCFRLRTTAASENFIALFA